MVLRATVRPMVGSCALYTTPMAPRPNSPIISYLPTVWMDIRFPLCGFPALLKPSGEGKTWCLMPFSGLGPTELNPVQAKNIAIFLPGQRTDVPKGTLVFTLSMSAHVQTLCFDAESTLKSNMRSLQFHP